MTQVRDLLTDNKRLCCGQSTKPLKAQNIGPLWEPINRDGMKGARPEGDLLHHVAIDVENGCSGELLCQILDMNHVRAWVRGTK